MGSESEERAAHRGKIVSYFVERGYGFIALENGNEGESIFFHSNDLERPALPAAGDIVTCRSVIEGEEGPRVIGVRVPGREIDWNALQNEEVRCDGFAMCDEVSYVKLYDRRKQLGFLYDPKRAGKRPDILLRPSTIAPADGTIDDSIDYIIPGTKIAFKRGTREKGDYVQIGVIVDE